jgi:hypothetical protein
MGFFKTFLLNLVIRKHPKDTQVFTFKNLAVSISAQFFFLVQEPLGPVQKLSPVPYTHYTIPQTQGFVSS